MRHEDRREVCKDTNSVLVSSCISMSSVQSKEHASYKTT